MPLALGHSRVFALAFLLCTVSIAFPLPVTFQQNRGQLPPQVAFLSRASGYRVFLTHHAAVIAPHDGPAVRMRLAGSSQCTPVGVHLLRAKTNYLLGSQWKTGIANYEGVTYPRVYPGIDLAWHAHGDQIEHDFLLAPGADPRHIRLAFSGPALRLSREGDLIAGTLLYHKPRAFQASREVECRYVLSGRSVRFALGSYDRTQPLTIDPVLSFSTYLGGSGTDTPVAAALDPAGNLYVAGNTTSLNFPVTNGAIQHSATGDLCASGVPFGGGFSQPCTDIFVAKFAGDGSTLLYATYLGGPAEDSVFAIAVGAAGNLYLAGLAAFPQKWLPQLTLLPGVTPGATGFFIAELSADGSSFRYATELPIAPLALSVDAAGAVYVMSNSNPGMPTVNGFQTLPVDPHLFKTVYDGKNWQPFTNGLPQDDFLAVVVDPSNPQVLYVVTYQHGLYKTTDGGAHWSPVGNGLDSQAVPKSLVIDPHSPLTIYLTALGPSTIPKIYKSTDGGATWAAAGAGITPGAPVSTVALDPANPSTLYATASSGLYKSTDGAATWNLISSTIPDVFNIVKILVDPSNASTIYAASGQDGVMKSTDGGATWSLINNGITLGRNVAALVIDPVSPQTLYAGILAAPGPYITTDGGAHWTQASSPPDVQALLVDPAVHSRIWAATTSGIYLSQDLGATWTRTPFPHLSINSLAADTVGAFYATADGTTRLHPFVLKLDASGKNIIYSTYIAGSANDYAYGIAVDVAGRAYITGQTDSLDFPLAAPLQPAFGGNRDAFITALDPSGSGLFWSTYFGGILSDEGSSIALDRLGDVHLAGLTSPAGTANGITGNPFVAKIKGDGSAAIFSTSLQSSSASPPTLIAPSVAADSAGNTYLAGSTSASGLPVVNALQTTIAGGADAYVAEFNGQTGALAYATYLGGSADDFARGLAVDSAGDVYLAGQTKSSDFPLKSPWQSSFSNTFLSRIAAQPLAVLTAATNAASYTALVAPGALVSLFGSALASDSASAAQLPLPDQLLDVQVTVNGVPAPLVYASPQQVNAQIPFEIQPGPAQVQLSSTTGTTTTTLPVAPVAPAIFSLNEQGKGAGAIQHGLTYQVVSDSSPATAGEIISIYCTGLGLVNPPAQTGAAPPNPPSQTVIPVQVSIAGVMATVSYQGIAPGFPGLYQVNAQIPAGTPSGAQPLQIIQNGTASNTVTVAIQ